MRENQADKNFRKIGECNDRIERVENIVVDGMPDFSCTLSGSDVWVEAKAPKEPKRKTTPLFGSNHKLTIEQQNWILRHLGAGGRAFIYIETDVRRMLVDGKHAERINSMTVEELMEISLWKAMKPMKKSEWKNLRRALL